MTNIERVNEKAKSKSQQRLFGMVYAYKNGKLDLDDLPNSLANKIKSIAEGERKKTGDKRKKTKGISKKDAKDFASTKHKKIPEKVTENKILKFNNFINESYDKRAYDKRAYDIILNDERNKDKKLIITFNENGIITNIINNIGVKFIYDVGDELYYPDFINLFYNKVNHFIEFDPSTKKNLIKLTYINSRNRNLTESKNNKMDALKGGEAEGMSLEDIAELHEIPLEYLETILDQAVEIEYEHTDDYDVAKRIALDHLTENPLYYDDKIGLPNMEEELDKMDDEEIEEIINDEIKDKIKKFNDFNDEKDN